MAGPSTFIEAVPGDIRYSIFLQTLPEDLENLCRSDYFKGYCVNSLLKVYFELRGLQYLQNPTTSMIISAKDWNSELLVNFFFNQFINNPSEDISKGISGVISKEGSAELSNPIDKIVPYTLLGEPFYLTDEFVEFIKKLNLGNLTNGFPVINLLKIVTEYNIGSELLLENILILSEVDMTTIPEIFEESGTSSHLTNKELIIKYIHKNKIPNVILDATEIQGLRRADLYAHLDMLNDVIFFEIPPTDSF